MNFKELCGMLLPSLVITLDKTSACASQGLEVNIRRNAMMGAKRGGSQVLVGSLEQLSGGQRTLVSLALLLSAAQVSEWAEGKGMADELEGKGRNCCALAFQGKDRGVGRGMCACITFHGRQKGA